MQRYIVSILAVIGSSLGSLVSPTPGLGAEPIGPTWVCAYPSGHDQQPILEKYVVDGGRLLVGRFQRFFSFTQKPFVILEDNQYGIVAVSTASESSKPASLPKPSNLPKRSKSAGSKRVNHVGEAAFILDKSSGTILWIEGFTDGPPFSSDRGTCISVISGDEPSNR